MKPVLVCAGSYTEALRVMRKRNRNTWHYVAMDHDLMGTDRPRFIMTDGFWNRPDATAIWEHLHIVQATEVKA